MSLQYDNSASTGGDESTPSPSLSSWPNNMFTLLRSAPAEKNMNGEQLAQTTVECLIADQIAIIFGFLKHNEIMHARVCTTWRDAAKKTLVPPSDFQVRNVRSYNALRVMSSALTNMQQLSICGLGASHKYSDGEDPVQKQAALTANYTLHDLNIISNFRKLRILNVHSVSLNGRYPTLFDFPHLQKLELFDCCNLKWDLDMLSACPLLRELRLLNLRQNSTGNLNSLRVLKNTLEEVLIRRCLNIRGNFMELADFPRLRNLDVSHTPVTGDIRHIQEDDFSAAKRVVLPDTVIGGLEYQFQSISDVPSFMHTIHPLLKRFPETFNQAYFCWTLSKDSADWYDREDDHHHQPPFEIFPVVAGGLRCGWSWCFRFLVFCNEKQCLDVVKNSCEVNWLDPEPSEDRLCYDKYAECLQKIEGETDFYRGYYEPPTEEEYRSLCLREREHEE